tara:strand:+ start:123094 stop:123279 length:186 start_codon:yes stop_codon:yes gene_type:complete
MQIYLDEDSYIKATLEEPSLLILSLKAKRDDDSHIIISAQLGQKEIDKLISSLVSFRTEMG